jgi:hypothetical protein
MKAQTENKSRRVKSNNKISKEKSYRIFDDKLIKSLIEENKISKKEYERILDKWKKKKSS